VPPEPKELTEARELLGKFEVEMRRPEGLVRLSEGLSLLADVRATAESERITQVVSNLALAYARKVKAEVELLLAQDLPPHWEIVAHWQQVLTEFERSGFSLPKEIGEPFLELLIRKLSPAERQELLEKLQAMDSP
jgi:hypothetical protein